MYLIGNPHIYTWLIFLLETWQASFTSQTTTGAPIEASAVVEARRKNSARIFFELVKF